MEHLPWAEVWLHSVDDEAWREASRLACALGKTGLEAWTTEATPEVVAFLGERGYAEVRRYLRSELDLATAREPDPPRLPVVTLAERPDLVPALYAVAAESYPDQPGRGATTCSATASPRSTATAGTTASPPMRGGRADAASPASSSARRSGGRRRTACASSPPPTRHD